MKTHSWEKFIVKIEPTVDNQDNNIKLSSQLVYDENDKTIRLDLSGNDVHQHVALTRKQAIKMIKLLEEFILHNP